MCNIAIHYKNTNYRISGIEMRNPVGLAPAFSNPCTKSTRIILNILAAIASVFYAFIVRGYNIADGLNNGELFLQIGIIVGIIAGIFTVANLLAAVLKKIPFLGKKVLISADLLIMRFIEV
ncbi:MAG: hypothetical protein EAZ41_05870, partial [Sphingobacteriia bacterium]